MSTRSWEGELNERLLAAFPEVAREYWDRVNEADGAEPPAHIMYSLVLVPWIQATLEAGHPEVLPRVATFVETLDTDDDFVGEVVQLSLLEPLHEYPLAWLPLLPQLGPKGAAIAGTIEKYFGPSIGD